ncbi:response regulator transcription factor [Leucobacter rhizosphaerae]|uniref:Response regulator transcription factor n=1 Tax=Leucobacter rhizosphaerae TaxID=2932245 RepID=A0ABY4FX16_9MICO|nr:response regulator transcription factor [Leucobacter rhizosphaerae]UOQ60805.1 response regulator transcription factor [Leucobacter rhizosphaerae]
MKDHQARSRTIADGSVSQARALIVDDERSLADLIGMALRYEGWETRIAESGTEALSAAREFAPDVIVLDIMLPDLDGVGVLQRLRESGDGVPVLFLTARDSVQDRITGLSEGGDDYVTKPFSLEEVVARVHALVRRSGGRPAAPADEVLRVGDLTLDPRSYEVQRGGDAIELTQTEFEVLRALMEHEQRVVTKAALYEQVWHEEFDGTSTVVELYISYLRKKIELGRTPMIRTVRGVGYLLKAGPDA